MGTRPSVTKNFGVMYSPVSGAIRSMTGAPEFVMIFYACFPTKSPLPPSLAVIPCNTSGMYRNH